MNRLQALPTIIKFAVVGGSGMCIRIAGMYILVDLAVMNYLLAFALLFAVVMAWNYTWNSLWTFPSKERGFWGFVKYCAVGLVALAVGQTVLYLLTDLAGVWYMASTIVAIVVGFLVNFTISKNWVWRRERLVRDGEVLHVLEAEHGLPHVKEEDG
jgi:putative flippase GtrA